MKATLKKVLTGGVAALALITGIVTAQATDYKVQLWGQAEGRDVLVEIDDGEDTIKLTDKEGTETYLLRTQKDGGWTIIGNPRINNITGQPLEIRGHLANKEELNAYMFLYKGETQRLDEIRQRWNAAEEHVQTALEIAGDQGEYLATLQAELDAAVAETAAAKAEITKLKGTQAKAKR